MPGRPAGHGEDLTVEELVLDRLLAFPRQVLGGGQLGAFGETAHAKTVPRARWDPGRLIELVARACRQVAIRC